MQIPRNFTFNPSGWLDRNDVIYWENRHGHWLKLFGHTEEGAVIESIFSPEEEAFEGKSTCTFYPSEKGGVELISLYLNVPPECFEQLRAMLIRHAKALEEVEVHIALEDGAAGNEVQVIELMFETCTGRYFE